MKFLDNISFLFRDWKKLSPQGEQWRELLHQISDIVENLILVFYNKPTKGRQTSSQLTDIVIAICRRNNYHCLWCFHTTKFFKHLCYEFIPP